MQLYDGMCSSYKRGRDILQVDLTEVVEVSIDSGDSVILHRGHMCVVSDSD